MKLYLDEDLSPATAEQLRRHGIDAVSAHETGMRGRRDAEHLALAARERRCLVTKNVSDFIALAYTAVQQGNPHAGIVLCPASVPGSDIGAIVTRLRRLVERFPRGLGPYDLIYM